MAVGRPRATFSLLFIAFLIVSVASWQVAKEAEDESSESDAKNDDPGCLDECKAHVLKALDQYWGTSKSDDGDDDDDHGGPHAASNDEGENDDEQDDSAASGNPVVEDDGDESAEKDDEDKDNEKDVPVKDDDDNEDDLPAKDDSGEEKDDDAADGDETQKATDGDETEKATDDNDSKEDEGGPRPEMEGSNDQEEITQAEVQEVASADDFVESEDDAEEEEEMEEVEVPQTGRDHIDKIMDLNEEADELEKQEGKLMNGIMKELKRLYDQSIKPVEQLYKYRDISTRRFADAEIYSQPMVLFVGPWNSGKSTMINYLLGIEGTEMALDTGAASKGSQFVVLTHADKERRLDGTEIAADWRFAGIQKFGQGFIDALLGVQLPQKLLEKITIVEAPGIRESQKNLNYPFDDSLQWFIDRADIIYVVFDPTKLEMGHEMELLMDQLKGREKYLRFLLNKADTVDTESIMKVTSQLFWTLSPMLSTPVVPISYSVSLWSKPYQEQADADYLSDQEVDMLRDLKKHTIDKLVENKLAHARRHAVTVRNHAKLVDCYLTHYYKHKTLFGNKNKVASEIINNPAKYKIFESLSMLNNVSRYDLPNPDIYKEFFKVTPLYDFKQLKNTCSYFKGCPLDKLNVCIAYDLPQLLGKYKKQIKDIHEGPDDKDKKN